MWHEVMKSGAHTVYAEGNMRLLATGTKVEHIYHVNPKLDLNLQRKLIKGAK